MIVTVTTNPAIDRTLEVRGFKVGATAAAATVGRSAGGKGVNVSRALAVLGHASVATGFLGAGDLAFYEEAFAGTGVELDFVLIDPPTRTSTTIVDPISCSITHLREPGPDISEAQTARLAAVLADRIGPRDTVVFSGSLPPGLAAAAFTDLLDAVAAHGASVVVDTSGPALAAAVRVAPFAVKPNTEELGELVGRSLGSIDAIARAVAEGLAGVKYAVVSRGARGGVLVGPQGAWSGSLKVPADRVLHSVGAGDAYLAGWLAAYLEDEAPPEMLRSALAAGAASLASTEAARFRRTDYEALLDRADVKPIR